MAGENITIGGRKVGAGAPVFIIAEAGVNHNGKLSLAKKLIDAAARSGADAVKFQTFDPDELTTKAAGKARYQRASEKRKETQHAMLRRLALKRKDFATLKSYAKKKGIVFLSTPFSLGDAMFLKKLGVPAIKVSSGDANNLPYLSRIAKWKLPLLLSTGMSDMASVKESVTALRKAGNRKLIVLHCTTNYPAAAAEANLRAIETLRKELSVPVGFSDHTEGTVAATAAVALGACVIEKHLTLDRRLPGPDHKASLTPGEFKALVRSIRYIEGALGTGKKTIFPSERENAKIARKSVVTLRAVKKGELFTEKSLGLKRPGTGLPPREYARVIGARATRDMLRDKLLKKDDYVR